MKHLALLCCLALIAITNAPADEPAAEEILAAARMNPMGEGITLEAQLRAGSVKVPFVIEVGAGAVRYGFSGPQQDILLRLGESESTLEERRDGTQTAVPISKFDDSVRGGLITYEDLALRFLYWKNPRLLESETVRSRDAWKIEIPAQRGASQYGVVRVWIDKQSAALLRIEGTHRPRNPQNHRHHLPRSPRKEIVGQKLSRCDGLEQPFRASFLMR
jgi:hypothetical protein